jgi:hypothetical protein
MLYQNRQVVLSNFRDFWASILVKLNRSVSRQLGQEPADPPPRFSAAATFDEAPRTSRFGNHSGPLAAFAELVARACLLDCR